MVHDAACCDPDGMVWYADFGSQFVGKLDPKTGRVTEYPVPKLKPDYPEGLMDVRFDKSGNVWFGMMAQGGLAKFGRETQKIQTWSLPAEVNGANSQVAMVMPHFAHVDGKVWTNNVGPRTVHRFDVNTEKWETIDPYATFRENDEAQSTYGINADSQNNLYANSRQGGYIGRIDAKTLEVKFFRPPTIHAGPRRGRIDLQDRLWVALSDVDKIGLLDPKADGIREWAVPTPFTQTYDVTADHFGDIWMGGESSDFVYRLNPARSEFTLYPLPKVHVNIRRVDVDSSQGRPIFWVGDDHSPTIYRLEPLD
jgi:streptogramin lyase